MKHDVTKFCGIYAHVEDQRRSGTSDVDALEDSLELYRLKHSKGSFFLFLHCWQLGRQMVPSSEPETDFVEVETIAIQTTSVVGIGRVKVRPHGNRVAKEGHKNAKIRDASIRAQVAATI